MTREEMINKVTHTILEGGWFTIHTLVSELTDEQLSYWANEEEEEGEDGI